MGRDTVSTPKFGSATKKFIDAGIHPRFLIPVAPPGAEINKNASLSAAVLGKAPGRYSAKTGQWGGLFGSVVIDGLTKADFTDAKDWPTGNIGVLGRAYPGIDSDAESLQAAALVIRVVQEEFGPTYAERIRGKKNHRRLYTFRARDWRDAPVKTRHLTWTLPGDEKPHKLDIIGLGAQYLIAGTHPSGDAYEWAGGADMADPEMHREMAEIENGDIERFLEAFEEAVTRAGGQITRASGGGGGTEKAVRDLKPVLSADAIFKGLAKLPNNSETFLHRDDFVSALAAIRAAAGSDSEDPQFEDDVREWACQDPAWCEEAYFDKVWNSLDRVRVSQDSLDVLFRKAGIFHQAAEQFDGQGPALSTGVRKEKAKASDDRKGVLTKVAAKYVFCDVNLKSGHVQTVMRNAWDAEFEWPALGWYTGKSTRPGPLDELYGEFGDKEPGFWNFATQMKNDYPESWYIGEIRDPYHEFGEIVLETNPETGRRSQRLNVMHLPATIRAAKKADKNPERSARDVATMLDFVNTLFGDMAKYELDTLAFMAQRNQRPGTMLFLVGDPGVGKSTHTAMCTMMFNGALPEQLGAIAGNKLLNESSARFALATVEGCRIISIREMPKGKNNATAMMQQVTALLKMLVDPGIEGDYFQIEKKRENLVMVKNHARVTMTSNFTDAIEVSADDRRIFMAEAMIRQHNKPPNSWYAEINDVIGDPERLAAFYRYLQTRDIGNYSRNTPPPVSSAKAKAIVQRIDVPSERHMRAAIELFKANNRRGFDTDELAEVMTEMSEAEYNFRGGDGDPKIDYKKMLASKDMAEKAKFAHAMKTLGRLCIATRPRRDSKGRDSRVYILPRYREMAERAETMDRKQIRDFADDEYDAGLPVEHPWDEYRKAPR